MPEKSNLRYLVDNSRILRREKFSDNPSCAIRLTGDERQLLNLVFEFLEKTYEARARGGRKSSGGGRPRTPDEQLTRAAKYKRASRERKAAKD